MLMSAPPFTTELHAFIARRDPHEISPYLTRIAAVTVARVENHALYSHAPAGEPHSLVSELLSSAMNGNLSNQNGPATSQSNYR